VQGGSRKGLSWPSQPGPIIGWGKKKGALLKERGKVISWSPSSEKRGFSGPRGIAKKGRWPSSKGNLLAVGGGGAGVSKKSWEESDLSGLSIVVRKTQALYR